MGLKIEKCFTMKANPTFNGFRGKVTPYFTKIRKNAVKNYKTLHEALVKQKQLITNLYESPKCFESPYFQVQLTVFEGLKSRIKKESEFLYHLKRVHQCGIATADAIAKDVERIADKAEDKVTWADCLQEFDKRFKVIFDNLEIK